MPNPVRRKKKNTKAKINQVVLMVMVSFFAGFLALATFIIYNLFFSSKVFPNVYVGSQNIGGLSPNIAYSEIKSKSDSFLTSQVEFIVEDRHFFVNVSDLGITFDNEATVRNAYRKGRSGNILTDSYFRLKVLLVPVRVAPVYKVDTDKFVATVDKSFSAFNKPAKNASIVFSDNKVQISSESEGRIVDISKLINDLIQNTANFENTPIRVNYTADKPKISKENLAKLKDKVESLTNQEIILTYADNKWVLSNKELFGMFKFFQPGYEDTYLVSFDFGKFSPKIVSVDAEQPKSLNISIHLDDEKINSYILDLESDINRDAIDASLKFENGKVSEFKPAQDGQILQRAQLLDKLNKILAVDNQETDKTIYITLPVSVTKAKIANDEINSLGIRELVGRGVSYFAHSIPNRAWNVGLGTSRVSGTLIKPGEIFSFNSTVGEVSAASGYRQAYVISSGKTVLDDGGGICQVSTTVFRAALNAGLPIITRTAHAYRVGYYEQNDTKPGFDATVFAPSVDFQFKNDTANSLLVQAVADQKLARLEVDIYGTADGRRVVMSEPVVSNQTPALPDKHQDDPTLPVGQIKQVDFAAAGATAVFSRKVYRDNDLILDDVFKSVYRPWAAVFLVGTKS